MKRFFDGGRMHELKSLEELYGRNEFAMAVVYGRRRISKTALIGEFISRSHKKAPRFTATENTDTVNRGHFSQNVSTVYPELSALTSFPTWESALEYKHNEQREKNLLL
ncbi:MAG: hypothetical protein FWH51_03410 [Dehalococcoidia bacterium]|nr:hypothetical protein [Dehalococcoidia bacterium]